MVMDCPVCGNEIVVNRKYNEGKCKFCKQPYKLKSLRKGNKTFYNIEENEENCKKLFTKSK